MGGAPVPDGGGPGWPPGDRTDTDPGGPGGPRRGGDTRFAVLVFAIVVALAVVGITVLVFATRPQTPETVAAGTTNAPPATSTPSSQREAPSSSGQTTTTRSRSTTTESTERTTTTSPRRSTTTTTSRSSVSGSYSPPGGEYTVTFPGRHSSVTAQLKGSVGSSAIEVVDAEATLGLESYIAMLADIPAPLTQQELEQTAKTMRANAKISAVKSVTVAGHSAVRFTLEQDGVSFDVVMVTSGKKMVILMAGTVSTGEVDFDSFVDSLKFP